MGDNPYIPHTPEDIRGMLATIGVSKLDDLFADIPPALRFEGQLDLSKGLSEPEVLSLIGGLAASNEELICFLGAGCYDHLVPSVVPRLSERAEFLTAYTPYQPEVSQGVLQALFEYQTLVCELMGLDVSNASLYDGHSAAAEACSIALQVAKGKTRKRILCSEGVHPSTLAVLATHYRGLEVDLVQIPTQNGVTGWEQLFDSLDESTAAVLVQSPNYYGNIEDLSGVAEKAHDSGAMLILSSNPISLGILKSPGEWGADIAVADGQPLGIPMYFGGPSVGLIAASERLLRRMPGRIVGQTLDSRGERAFVLTLQAREQHIKRERATSNICTNQSLTAIRAAIFMAALGKRGFKELAEQNLSKAHYFASRLCEDGECRMFFAASYFNEFVIDLHRPAGAVLAALRSQGILGGLALPELSDSAVLVAVTEKRSRTEMDRYVEILKAVPA